MLVVVSTRGVRFDAGSIAVALCRHWSRAGRDVLFVDADLDATGLAERFGTAVRSNFAPALRGVPTLIAAGEPLSLDSVAPHSYSRESAGEKLWLLFAPFNVAGAGYAAAWLVERADDLVAMSAQRRVVVASALLHRDGRLLPLLRAAAVVVILGIAETDEQVTLLRTVCEDAGLLGLSLQHRLLLLEGTSPLDDDELRLATGLHVGGRLPFVEDERVLSLPGGRMALGGGRRMKAFAEQIAAAAAHLDSVMGGERADAAPVVGRLPVVEDEQVLSPPDERKALGVGRMALGVGRMALGVGRMALGVGRMALGVGRMALGVGRRMVKAFAGQITAAAARLGSVVGGESAEAAPVVGGLPVVEDEGVLSPADGRKALGGRMALGGGRRVKAFVEQIAAAAAHLGSAVGGKRAEAAPVVGRLPVVEDEQVLSPPDEQVLSPPDEQVLSPPDERKALEVGQRVKALGGRRRVKAFAEQITTAAAHLGSVVRGKRAEAAPVVGGLPVVEDEGVLSPPDERRALEVGRRVKALGVGRRVKAFAGQIAAAAAHLGSAVRAKRAEAAPDESLPPSPVVPEVPAESHAIDVAGSHEIDVFAAVSEETA